MLEVGRALHCLPNYKTGCVNKMDAVKGYGEFVLKLNRHYRAIFHDDLDLLVTFFPKVERLVGDSFYGHKCGKIFR